MTNEQTPKEKFTTAIDQALWKLALGAHSHVPEPDEGDPTEYLTPLVLVATTAIGYAMLEAEASRPVGHRLGAGTESGS